MGKESTIIAQINASIERRKNKIGALEAEIAGLEVAKAALLGDADQQPEESAAPSTARSKESNSTRVRRAAYEILLSEGRPMHRKLLLERVQVKGLHVGGKSPLHSFGALLSTDSRFATTHERGVWGLAIWEIAEEPEHALPQTC